MKFSKLSAFTNKTLQNNKKKKKNREVIYDLPESTQKLDFFPSLMHIFSRGQTLNFFLKLWDKFYLGPKITFLIPF